MCDTDSGTWRKNLSFEYIGHFSRYIKTGARRIGIARYTDRLEATAFKNPDGAIAAVMLNRGDGALPVHIRVCGRICDIELPPHSIATALMS
jgi:glucosylceramidase